MKIGLCQLNSTMGDIAGNTGKIIDAIKKTSSQKPDLLVFPELFINGYPPRDLLENKWFIQNGMAALKKLCEISAGIRGTGILTGMAFPEASPMGRGLFNSAVLVYDGAVVFRQDKSLLPTYDVFDEWRYFDPSRNTSVFPFKNEKLGITICEDAWNSSEMWDRPLYGFDPVERMASAGATLLVNISASPYNIGKQRLRHSIVQAHSARHRLPFVFVNLTGGNDELIFDGNSMYFDGNGSQRAVLPSFTEEISVIDTACPPPSVNDPEFDTVSSVHEALVTGIRDYFSKCGMSRAIVGLSGGIDSALTCALAVRALGSAAVTGVSMPSRYSSQGSKDDAEALAKNLGVEYITVPVEPAFEAFLSSLEKPFAGKKPDLTEENLQARIRGTILMALSNKTGALVLSTGNKSEIAVGYCTLYGDMNGGLSVIADIPKMRVYELARYINRSAEIIPESSILKAPSAELRENQKDQDSLPPYDTLDAIIEMLVEEGISCEEAASRGFDIKTVKWVSNAISRSEYKRRQAAPGLRVTPKAFGMGRRFPIAARYER
jgi:NAD+ synthase (glutamine-hydrolysing)